MATSEQISKAGPQKGKQEDSFMPPAAPRAKKATRTLSGAALRYVRSMTEEDNSWAPAWKPQSQEPNRRSVIGIGSNELGYRSTANGNDHLPQAEVIERHEAPSSQAAPERFEAEQKALPPIVGFLVSFDVNPAGEAYAMREGRWVISSVPVAVPNSCIVISDKSLSPMHATLRVNRNGRVDILDQFSEQGTYIYRGGVDQSIKVADSLAVLEHGDVVAFGSRRFNVCLISNNKQNAENSTASQSASNLPAVVAASSANSAKLTDAPAEE